MIKKEIFVTKIAKGTVGKIRAKMRILTESHEVDGIRLRVRS